MKISYDERLALGHLLNDWATGKAAHHEVCVDDAIDVPGGVTVLVAVNFFDDVEGYREWCDFCEVKPNDKSDSETG